MDAKKKIRYPFIDLIRAIAVYLMIVFHIGYDLKAFNFVSIDFHDDFTWWILPRVIVFLFLIAVGMSLPIVHSEKIRWDVFWPRQIKLIFFAALISLSTYFFFPNNWVYFGTLHCIALCSFAALPLIKRPKLCFAIAFFILVRLAITKQPLPFPNMPHPSMDYIPFFPWIAFALLGITASHYGLHKLALPSNRFIEVICWPGKKSLWIYLIHQPLLYGIIWAVYELTRA